MNTSNILYDYIKNENTELPHMLNGYFKHSIFVRARKLQIPNIRVRIRMKIYVKFKS